MKMKKYIAIFLLLFITACSGEHSGKCIPENDPNARTAEGYSQNSPEAIFEYVKDKQIISTTIATIRSYVIGDSPVAGAGGRAGAAQNIFTAITSSPSFTSAITAAFSLSIIFYGLGVITGIIQTQLGDALVRVGKIIIVAVIATNWTIFYQVVGSFFITLTDEVIFYMMQSFGDLYQQGPSFGTENPLIGGESGNNLFADMDLFFVQIFSIHTYAIMSALISPFGKNAGPYSNIYALFLMFSIYQIMTGVFRVVLVYAFSLFAKALLFALAPIFFTFLLFGQTKYLFDAWLKLQISFTLQPIFIMSFLGIFVSAISPLFKELYALQVCYEAIDGDTHRWRFKTGDGQTRASSVSDVPPISLQSLLMLFFFAWMFKSYLELADGMARAIVQSVTGNLSSTASAVAASLNGGGDNAGGGGAQSAQQGIAAANNVARANAAKATQR